MRIFLGIFLSFLFSCGVEVVDAGKSDQQASNSNRNDTSNKNNAVNNTNRNSDRNLNQNNVFNQNSNANENVNSNLNSNLNSNQVGSAASCDGFNLAEVAQDPSAWANKGSLRQSSLVVFAHESQSNRPIGGAQLLVDGISGPRLVATTDQNGCAAFNHSMLSSSISVHLLWQGQTPMTLSGLKGDRWNIAYPTSDNSSSEPLHIEGVVDGILDVSHKRSDSGFGEILPFSPYPFWRIPEQDAAWYYPSFGSNEVHWARDSYLYNDFSLKLWPFDLPLGLAVVYHNSRNTVGGAIIEGIQLGILPQYDPQTSPRSNVHLQLSIPFSNSVDFDLTDAPANRMRLRSFAFLKDGRQIPMYAGNYSPQIHTVAMPELSDIPDAVVFGGEAYISVKDSDDNEIGEHASIAKEKFSRFVEFNRWITIGPLSKSGRTVRFSGAESSTRCAAAIYYNNPNSGVSRLDWVGVVWGGASGITIPVLPSGVDDPLAQKKRVLDVICYLYESAPQEIAPDFDPTRVVAQSNRWMNIN